MSSSSSPEIRVVARTQIQSQGRHANKNKAKKAARKAARSAGGRHSSSSSSSSSSKRRRGRTPEVVADPSAASSAAFLEERGGGGKGKKGGKSREARAGSSSSRSVVERPDFELAKVQDELDRALGKRLRGKAKREWLEARAVKLGAFPFKKEKAPYAIRMGKARAQRKRDALAKVSAKNMGLVDTTAHANAVRSKAKRPSGHSKADFERLRKSSNYHDSGLRGLKTNIGTYRNGVVHISNRVYNEHIKGKRRRSTKSILKASVSVRAPKRRKP